MTYGEIDNKTFQQLYVVKYFWSKDPFVYGKTYHNRQLYPKQTSIYLEKSPDTILVLDEWYGFVLKAKGICEAYECRKLCKSSTIQACVVLGFELSSDALLFKMRYG